MKDDSTNVLNDEVQESMNLPENAFTELKPGEEYVPPMRPDKTYPEATGYSVSMGLIMAVIFSAAAAYLGLKVGQVFEAAIPIAIIAAGIAGVTKRKNSLGENVIIQSIGAASGIVVAGAIFTLPALYILQAKYPEITVNFLEVFLSSLLGGLLGILFFIPFRKYFVKDMHGKFPFPEATATTQVLISGQKGGSQAKPLLMAGLVGGLYDFFLSTFGWWKEVLSTQAIPALQTFTHNTKMMFSINTGSAVLGLGYIVGLRYAFIIFAGSAFIWWCIVPLLGSSDRQPHTSHRGILRGSGYRLPVHHRGSQRYRYRGQQPCIGHDFDDPHRGKHHFRGYWLERHPRHHRFDGDWWCGLHRALYGWRYGYRYEDWLLVGLYSC